jgi:hypothetical protein
VTSPEPAPEHADTFQRPTGRQTWPEVYERQISSFIRAVSNREPADVTGHYAVTGVELIDACYANRRVLVRPWDLPVGGRE